MIRSGLWTHPCIINPKLRPNAFQNHAHPRLLPPRACLTVAVGWACACTNHFEDTPGPFPSKHGTCPTHSRHWNTCTGQHKSTEITLWRQRSIGGSQPTCQQGAAFVRPSLLLHHSTLPTQCVVTGIKDRGILEVGAAEGRQQLAVYADNGDSEHEMMNAEVMQEPAKIQHIDSNTACTRAHAFKTDPCIRAHFSEHSGGPQ